MKRISIEDASVLSFLVRHRKATEAQVDSVLAKVSDPSLRAAFRNVRRAATGKKTKPNSLGSKTGRLAKDSDFDD
jgi:hypothetical protein